MTEMLRTRPLASDDEDVGEAAATWEVPTPPPPPPTPPPSFPFACAWRPEEEEEEEEVFGRAEEEEEEEKEWRFIPSSTDRLWSANNLERREGRRMV